MVYCLEPKPARFSSSPCGTIRNWLIKGASGASESAMKLLNDPQKALAVDRISDQKT